jgi:hypothetical protein
VRNIAVTVAAAAVAAGLLAGCGGDAKPSGGFDAAQVGDVVTSKQAFIDAADAICHEYGKKFDAVPLPEGDPTAAGVSDKVLAQAAQTARKLASIEREMAAQLRGLEPPADFGDEFDKSLDELEARVEHFDNLADAAKIRDRSAVAEEFRLADRAATKGRRAIAGYGSGSAGSASQGSSLLLRTWITCGSREEDVDPAS